MNSNSKPTPPFSETIKLDKNLQFNDSYIQIDELKKQLNNNELESVSEFPTTYVFARLASKAYENVGETQEEINNYEIDLPVNWKLLYTATNTTNGYFGVAYWNQETKQVIIAHRGTESNNFDGLIKDLWTDIKGVFLNKHVSQINSACSFTTKVLSILSNKNIQLFITGHSLGGWLAQITTFSIKYLTLSNESFQKKQSSDDGYHAHTVVFESPGCKDMLFSLESKYDVRHSNRSIFINDLDITSYLSAPNLINTCKAHIGKIYRIFVDLSINEKKDDKSQLRIYIENIIVYFPKIKLCEILHKKILHYTSKTHSIEKILETFDNSTGHIKKENIKEVIDWPITECLNFGHEYTEFFKWANEINNYDPHDSNEFQAKIKYNNGYYPIRYQTKDYNEKVCSISVFNQNEQNFLKKYQVLREFPKIFKKDDIFNSIEDQITRTNTENLLRNFKIKNENETNDSKIEIIVCESADKLNKLIPYVKRLLQLFPEVKNYIEGVSSEFEMYRIYYQYESLQYLENIKNSILDFNNEINTVDVLKEFLNNNQKKVLKFLVKDCTHIGLTKIYKILQKIKLENSARMYQNEDNYVILELKQLLLVNQYFNLKKFLDFQEMQYYLFIIELNRFDNKDYETEITQLQDFINLIIGKSNIKIILIEKSDKNELSSNTNCAYLDIKIDEGLRMNDLTIESQTEILKKKITFQGKEISLNSLIDENNQELKMEIMDTEILVKLINDSKIIIGNEKKAIDKIANYYKPRVLINQNQKLKYLDLIGKSDQYKVIIISDTAGNGKSTTLSHISQYIKTNLKNLLYMRIDLNDYTNKFDELILNGGIKEPYIDSVIEFLSRDILNLNMPFEKKLFKHIIQNTGNLIIMFDGFDEICPTYKDIVINIIKVLKSTKIKQLWITTRHNLKEYLQNELEPTAFSLEPFSRHEQVEFLINYWKHESINSNNESMLTDNQHQQKLRSYAFTLIEITGQNINDNNFTDNMLLTRMLADVYEKNFQNYYNGDNLELKNLYLAYFDLNGLFEKFFQKKFEIFQVEKNKLDLSRPVIDRRRRYFKFIREHEKMALITLFNKDTYKNIIKEKYVQEFTSDYGEPTGFQKEKIVEKIDKDLNLFIQDFKDKKMKYGIIDQIKDNEPKFIHRTFAQYLVANFLADSLAQKTETISDFIIKEILINEKHKMIRVFLNNRIRGITIQESTRELYRKSINSLREELNTNNPPTKQTGLHVAVIEKISRLSRFYYNALILIIKI